ncbi:MAG: TonB-dependent receptor [Phycisphaerae bacterium]
MKKQRHNLGIVVKVGMFLLLLAVPLALPASAPKSSEPIEDIDLLELNIEEVVTGMRGGKRTVKDMPYAVSVITAEDIRRAGSRSVPDALRLVPGVDVADISYGFETVGVRGFYANQSSQSLVLVDGRQVYDSLLGGTYWGIWPFQLEDIDRIEVIRGPAGVAWGANATNGIINIVTKDPSDQHGVTSVNRGGSRGMNKEYLGYGFTDGKLRMRVSGEYEGCDGFAEGGSILRKLDDGYKSGRFGLYGVYEQSPSDTITFSGGSSAVDGCYAPGIAGGLFGLMNPGGQSNFFLTRWDHKITKDNSYALTGYVNDFHQNLGGEAYDYRYQQFALQFSNTLKPAENHTLIWGIDTREDLIDGDDADPHFLLKNQIDTATIGTYIEDDWRFAPKWALSLGGRIDYESYTGFQPSGRAALSYQPDKKSMIYGAISRAFRAHTAGVRNLDLSIMNGLMTMQADRDVRPLTEIAYEIGYRRRYFNRLDTALNLYWQECADASGFVTKLGLPRHLLLTNMQRAGDYSLYGVELETKYAVTQKLSLLGNYTFQMMDWRASGEAGDFSLAVNGITPPKHKFMIGPRYDVTDNFHLSSQLWYVGAVRSPLPTNPFASGGIDPYFRWDIRAEYEFWKKRAAFAVGVTNLLDPSHSEGRDKFFNNAEVPRMIYAEFRVTFK